MNHQQAERLAKSLMRTHRLSDWGFVWIDSGRIFGRCCYDPKQIQLSAPMVATNKETEVINTILHEIAHGKAGPGAGHGSIWKRIAVEIGVKPEGCYDPREVTQKYSVYCKLCKKALRQAASRWKDLNASYCVACGPSSAGFLVYVPNHR